MNTIHVKRFWIDYKTKAVEGDMVTTEVDMVEYGPMGALDRTSNVVAVSRISNVNPDPDNPAAQIARARWEQIRPLYEAWKAGREAPISGTALAAWPGISPEQAEHFRMMRIRTVEEIAQLTDTHVSRLNLPNVRNLIEQAKAFIANKGPAAMASEIDELRQMIASLKEDNEAARQALLDDETPKRRGRPPKAAEIEEAA